MAQKKTNDNTVQPKENGAEASGQTEWTIMIYFAGDNNLNDEMIRAIDQISSGFALYSAEKIAILAEFDGSHPAIKTKRYNFLLKQNNYYEIDNEPSSGKESIVDFVKACVDGDRNSGGKFPGYRAKKYSLILSGHGDGVRGKSLLLDSSPFGVLTIQDLGCALKTIKDKIIKKKMTILGMDSCLMNSLEISCEIKNSVEFLVASQSNIPNSGWDYKAITNKLLATPPSRLTKEYVAKEILTKTLKDYNKAYAAYGGRSLDLSVCNLSQLGRKPEDLLSSLEELANTLLNALLYREDYEEHPQNIPFLEFPENWITKILLMAHWRCQTYLSDQSIDLKDFCKCLIREIEEFTEDFSNFQEILGEKRGTVFTTLGSIREKCEKVIEQIDTGFVKKGIYSGADDQYSNGVSLFFPWSFLTYSITRDAYEELKFYTETGAGKEWSTFIRHFTRITKRKGRGAQSPWVDREFPPVYRGLETFLEYFGRVKNFPLNWEDAEGEFPDDYNSR